MAGRRAGRGVPLSTRYQRGATDSPLVGDAALHAADSLALIDVAEGSIVGSRAIEDALLLGDFAIAEIGDFRGATETLSLSDSATITQAAQRTADDSLRFIESVAIPVLSTVATRGMLMRGVAGSRNVRNLPFSVGVAAAIVTMPFDVSQDDVSVIVALPFLLAGPAGSTVVTPFDVEGLEGLVVETPFSILDATTGTSGDHVVAPLTGWWQRARTRTLRYVETVRSTPGIEGYWRLGDTSGAAEDELGIQAGTYDTAVAGTGLVRLDPDGAISLREGAVPMVVPSASGSRLDPSTWDGLTVECWALLTTLSSGEDRLVRKDETFALVRASGGELAFHVTLGAVSTPAAEAVTAAIGERYHLVGTYDATSGDVTLYVNGAPVADVTRAGSMAANGNDIEVGHTGTGGTGLIDETALYSRALGADEVLSHWKAGR